MAEFLELANKASLRMSTITKLTKAYHRPCSFAVLENISDLGPVIDKVGSEPEVHIYKGRSAK